MTPTAPALLATVRDNPGDTTARKVYADALEESGDEVGAAIQRAIAERDNDGCRLALADALERTAGEDEACKACIGDGERRPVGHGEYAQCKPCHGTGRVSDGRKEWSEFIRVQCELAANAVPNDATPAQLREAERRMSRETWDALRARERELWPAVRGRFEVGGAVPMLTHPTAWTAQDVNAAGFGHQIPPGSTINRIQRRQAAESGDYTVEVEFTVPPSRPIVIIQRGLPSVVRCTLAEWMGRTCGACTDGRLYHGSNGNPWSETCDICHGEGRTTGIGPRLAQAWPIERVEVSDKTPWRSSSPHFWSWWNEDYSDDAVDLDRLGVLPRSVFFKLVGWGSLNSNMYREYDTEPAARAALSDAAIAWARGQVIEETK